MVQTIPKKQTFQFHSGAIKTSLSRMVEDMIDMFQFHSGAIKTRIRYVGMIRRQGFQFHSGAIKTPCLHIM